MLLKTQDWCEPRVYSGLLTIVESLDSREIRMSLSCLSPLLFLPLTSLSLAMKVSHLPTFNHFIGRRLRPGSHLLSAQVPTRFYCSSACLFLVPQASGIRVSSLQRTLSTANLDLSTIAYNIMQVDQGRDRHSQAAQHTPKGKAWMIKRDFHKIQHCLSYSHPVHVGFC